MRPSFLPRLVNGPFDDPGLFVPLTFHKRALLLDMGELTALSPGDILKISHIFVSHTHMDHFIGFDQVLRLLLGRDKVLRLYGPSGFLENVAGKLRAYTWNLVQNYNEGLVLEITEILPHAHITQRFDCRQGFAASHPKQRITQDRMIHHEPALYVQTAILEHEVPSLAFAVKERFHINILREKLEAMGLSVGPWVGKFKRLLFEMADADTALVVPGSDPAKQPQAFTVGELAGKITRITPGQKVTYVVDAAYSPENREKIIELARDSDHLFIEAAFLDQDRQMALAKHHLTAHQAGTLARKAGVRDMTIFHHSPRYLDQEEALKAEAMAAFRGANIK